MNRWGTTSAIIGGVGGFLYFPVTLVFSDVSWFETIAASSFLSPMTALVGVGAGFLCGAFAGFVYSIIINAEVDINPNWNPKHNPFKNEWVQYTHKSYYTVGNTTYERCEQRMGLKGLYPF